ncbi:MAG: hypothetical protein H0U44_08100, partial [Flavisolibacter sp.]|nr:hypothetical protein [Flavisolibacter sp.]
MRKLLLPLILLLFVSSNLNGQCLTAPTGLWPSATFTPTCTGTAQDITTGGWAGEYSNVNVISGSTYIFSSSVASDFITIGNDAGTVAYTSGTTPVTWTASVTGVVRFFTHLNAACDAEVANRTRSVACTNTSCSGTPNAGTLNASSTSVCFGTPVTFTLAGATSGQAGITVQWQAATIGSPTFSNITAPNANSFTINPVQSYQYRAIITCSNGGGTATSNVVQVDVTSVPTYAVFPYTQNFESWVNGCSTSDRPDAHWGNSPSTGNNSWRRNDQGSTANWTSLASGGYTPTSSSGLYSARFHTYDAPAGTPGTMDLFIDLSNPAPTKFLKFDYINTSGSDVLAVLYSTDGGLTFTQAGTNLGVSATWTSREFAINSTSATTIIRLRATGDSGVTDIGVDNLSVAVGCSGTPNAGVATATPASVCFGSSTVLTATGLSAEAGVSLQWQASPDGTTWTNIAGATSASYTATPTGNFQYRLVSTCSNGNATATSTAATVTLTSIPTYIAIPYFQGFENWINGCSTSDRPDAHWGSNPVTGNNSWRRNDEGATANWTLITNGMYTPASSQGTFSARFHTYEVLAPGSGSMDLFMDLSDPAPTKFLKFDHINTSGSDVLAILVSTNGGLTFTQVGTNIGVSSTWTTREIAINSTSATTIIRFRATSDWGVSDIGIDNLSVAVGCSGTPNAGTATATPASICYGSTTVLGITANSVEAGITTQWQSS